MIGDGSLIIIDGDTFLTERSYDAKAFDRAKSVRMCGVSMATLQKFAAMAVPTLTSFGMVASPGKGNGDAGIKAIVESTWFTQLDTLSLRQTGATPIGVVRLVMAPCARIRKLTLSAMEVGEIGVRAIASGDWGSLEYLNLSSARTGPNLDRILAERQRPYSLHREGPLRIELIR